jgi:hypothetical protein
MFFIINNLLKYTKWAAKLDIIFEKTISYFKKNRFFSVKTVQR